MMDWVEFMSKTVDVIFSLPVGSRSKRRAEQQQNEKNPAKQIVIARFMQAPNL